jgi:nucleotide-binding universal stress UspA family protein
MTETPRIVVGIDGSEPSRVALRWALAEALVRGSVLEVLHAWHTPLVFVPEAYSPELVEMGRMDEAALRFVDHELDAIGADGDCPVVIEKSEAQHFSARALVDASHRAELIVLGRHGLGGFPHELMTPKVIQVAHHAVCAVAVVPDAWSGDGRGVVVGVDGSEHSGKALRWAHDEAHRRSAPLTTVMSWGLLDQHHVHGEQRFDPNYTEADAQGALDGFVTKTLGDGALTVERTVVNDLPARALLEASEHAELLVVGARGLGGFSDLLLGSVSHRCLAHSACPTVAIR